MLTLTLTARVDENGEVTLQVPPGIPPGYHKMVIVIEEVELPVEQSGIHDSHVGKAQPVLMLPIHDIGPWPENFSLR
ncbi:MAG: hypothetical protein KF832_27285 [Caldilineaceae bacterium]|nr:hypothetical protein [Caldilineaceae bacterium]